MISRAQGGSVRQGPGFFEPDSLETKRFASAQSETDMGGRTRLFSASTRKTVSGALASAGMWSRSIGPLGKGAIGRLLLGEVTERPEV